MSKYIFYDLETTGLDKVTETKIIDQILALFGCTMDLSSCLFYFELFVELRSIDG